MSGHFHVTPLTAPNKHLESSVLCRKLPCSGVVNTGHFERTDVSESPKLGDDVPLGTMQCMSVRFSR